eukprot:TRINITY_DN18165_c0_g1_i1.p1 TRINITY_DN18165_c0_g1~~TRINITY_DN18165_c0_g1_i1.p1  ORF type:complete len:163 (-),score=10.07 TRINITY_DN18165_c0_g1_i1:222-710(-)
MTSNSATLVPSKGTIYTIGHSNHPPERFFQLIKMANIGGIADVRSIPASSRFPHFSKKKFERICSAWDVEYTWFNALGGKGDGIEENMKRPEGQLQLNKLVSLAYQEQCKTSDQRRWAMMCSEHDWRQCHRQFLSEWLVQQGFKVVHIDVNGNLLEHGQEQE